MKQSMTATQGYIPVLSTNAGSTLTVADWETVGVDTASYHLATLLMKPGLALLDQLPSLATYVGWSRRLVLNAADLVVNRKTGMIVVRSLYDGSVHRYTVEALIAVIQTLKPDVFILPQGALDDAWLVLAESMALFVPVKDAPRANMAHMSGVLMAYDEQTTPVAALLTQFAHYRHLSSYVAGNVSPAVFHALIAEGITCVETDKPAEDAVLGLVYTPEGEIAIQDLSMQMAFKPIDATCTCVTCASALTRAYLHHLYEHTPGLCHRFLIQHNAGYVNAHSPRKTLLG